MRQSFKHHYRPTDAEFEELNQSATIIPDTNVLLNLYRYTQATRDELLKIFTALKCRLWLPHQAGFEFHNNRLGTISAQLKAYDELRTEFEKSCAQLEGAKSRLSLGAAFTTKLDAFRKDLETEIECNKNALSALASNDAILEQVTKIFDQRVGEKFSPDELDEHRAEADRRYKRQKPPGFKDADKPGANKYGDYILWKQILLYGAKSKVPIIFVTDDRKEDWWHKHNGKYLGPLPELREELSSVSEKPFYMYRPEQFMEVVDKFLTTPAEPAAIKEVRELPPIEAERIDMRQRREKSIGMFEMDNARSLIRYSKIGECSPKEVQDAIERLRGVKLFGGPHMMGWGPGIRHLIRELEKILDAKPLPDSSDNESKKLV